MIFLSVQKGANFSENVRIQVVVPQQFRGDHPD